MYVWEFSSHLLLNLVNLYTIDSPKLYNISYTRNFGSLLVVCLIIQIIIGVTLAMHYTPNILDVFDSIEYSLYLLFQP